MDAKKQRLITVLLVAGFMFVGLVMVNGCKKEEPTPPPADTSTEHDDDHGEEGHTHDDHSETAMTMESATEVATTGEQTMCPIMEGKPINKAISTEYKGKKVYFCCPGCDTKFKEDPEKYVAKLPQFNQ